VKRTKSTAALILCTAFFAAACSGGDDDASATTPPSSTEREVATTTSSSSTSTTTSTSSTTTTTTIPDIPRMPLTGEPIDDLSEIPDRPALVVKISNYPQGIIPQAGLNSADLVFEEVINSGATRLAAIFHSQEVDPVGPIRSGRAQDINLLLSLQRPLFAWSGGNPAVTRAIRDSDLIDLSMQHSSGYYRRSGRSDANTVFSSSEALWAQSTDEAGRPTPVYPYLREGQTLTGDPATSIEVQLDNVTAVWTYDEETEGYFREQNGREHTTETSDGVERVWVRNVVVMLADYGRNQFDGNPDAEVLGSNPVYVFSGGLVQVGEWLRFLPEDPFDLFDNFDDLNPLPLQPGRTWMEIPRNLDDVVTWEP
jgi:hypothetical protein